ncbi:DUF6357 family protein, partial [Streptomyces aureus]
MREHGGRGIGGRVRERERARMLGAGADANHEPRTFTFPIGEA